MQCVCSAVDLVLRFAPRSLQTPYFLKFLPLYPATFFICILDKQKRTLDWQFIVLFFIYRSYMFRRQRVILTQLSLSAR
jgi:hypothetical protein